VEVKHSKYKDGKEQLRPTPMRLARRSLCGAMARCRLSGTVRTQTTSSSYQTCRRPARPSTISPASLGPLKRS
jgi:hypothetical protein